MIFPQNSIIKFAQLFAAIFFCTFNILAANVVETVQYRFESFTTDNGLPQNGVRGIAQTPDGYLWFTTFDGLVRFDGLKFSVFDKNNSQGISSNRFSLLKAENDGSLIVGTEENWLTIYREGVFKSYNSADGLPIGLVQDFAKNKHGEFYAATTAGNFYFRNESFVPVPDDENPNLGRFYLAPSGNLWLYNEIGLSQISPDGSETFYPIKTELYNNYFSGIKLFEDSLGNLWFGDLNGVYCLKNGEIKSFSVADGVPKRMGMRPFLEDSDGSIWFASALPWIEGVGVVRFKDGKFTAFGKQNGLSSNFVANLFKDHEGTIWVTTDKGLNSLQKQFVKSYSTADGLINNEVYPLLQTRNGDIYIGTMQGLSKFRDGSFENLSLKNEKGDKISVTSLYEDNLGRLWIGVVGDLYILENDNFKSVSGFKKITVWAINNDREGNIWVGSEKGLFKFRDDEIVAKYSTVNGLPSDDVKMIYEDSSGAIWFGTYGGLVKFENGVFNTFTTAEGLASNSVRTIYQDREQTLWIGTYDGGLSRFRDGNFFNFTMESGLFNNGVFQIFEDDNRNFWISSNKGIYRVNKNELEDFADGKIAKINSIAYGKQDGMLNTECNGGRQPAGLKSADGKFWFPTQDGIAVLNPKDVSFNKHPPSVQIENVLIERENVAFNDGITLQANDNNLEIRYTGITFIKPEQVKFRYRIEGLDENWTNVAKLRDVYFPFLPAGEYTFRVIAANSDGVWNEQGATLAIKVLPQFWQTWWFLFLTIFLVGCVAYFIYRRRIGALQKANFAKETFARQLIDSQENERRRIAAELHDSLGQSLILIKNWALLALRTEQKQTSAKANLVEISETASDAIKEVREIAYNLGPFQLERLGLRNTIIEMIEKVGDASTIKFTSEIDEIDGIFAKGSEVNIFRIVQEAINNIVKHSAASEANLRIEKDFSQIILTISDNGKGFVAETSDKNRGFGLLGMTERVNLLKGEFSIKSEAGSWTVVRVVLPSAFQSMTKAKL
jgi:signal transduction histidine kinase/ligand-binding sensor domain-containing protein